MQSPAIKIDFSVQNAYNKRANFFNHNKLHVKYLQFGGERLPGMAWTTGFSGFAQNAAKTDNLQLYHKLWIAI
jgi:hypothetical protein